MLGMPAWGIELCYLTPLEFVYLCICLKRGSGKRAVMDSYTGSTLRFQNFFFFSVQKYPSLFLLFLISLFLIFHDREAL